MNKDGKIYVAGHTGLVGSAIVRKLKDEGFHNFVFRTISELDLCSQQATADFFKVEKPDYVFLAAAKVGGIVANNTYRAEFIFDNIQIQNNIIHNSYINGVKKLLFLGSSCIYPKNAPQPLKEEHLLTSPLEYTNEPYAIAKIAGIKMSESYNLQYGTNYISVMPTNLYGPNDNFDLEKSHVLPALIRKMHLGKALYNGDWDSIRKDFSFKPVEGINGQADEKMILEKLEKYGISKTLQGTNVTLWGTGTPKREFLYSDDLAAACVFIMNKVDFADLVKMSETQHGEIRNTHINIGSGTDLTIKELAEIVKKTIEFKGDLIWDHSKPDGTPQKLLDVTKLQKLGWTYSVKLSDGIRKVYSNYVNNQ
jgi:GDP-L-fucose synthase